MKRIYTLLLVLALGGAAQCQATDTAAQIVDHYLELLGTSRWQSDSMLVMETLVTSPGSTDTFVMKRWYLAPQMLRVEVWHGKELQTAYCSNGKDRYRSFRPRYGYWSDMQPGHFQESIKPYDFRGPLHGWRAAGATLTYMGMAKAMGLYEMQSVKVESPGLFTRYYLFEPSGLLSVIVETDELDSNYNPNLEARIEWKIEHEYMQLGDHLLPKQESFMREGKLTVLETTAWMEKRNTLVFNQD